jgi:hypothetical protein
MRLGQGTDPLCKVADSRSLRSTNLRALHVSVRLLVVLCCFGPPFQQPSKQTNLEWKRLSKPSSTLCVISNIIASVWMQQCRQGTTVDNQPWNEGTKLGRREQVDFEHGNRMGTNWLIPYSVYAQLRDCEEIISSSHRLHNPESRHTLSSDALPQLGCKLDLRLDVLLEVDMDIEPAALVVRDGVDERVVCLTWLVGWWVHVGLAVRILLAVPDLELCLASWPRKTRSAVQEVVRLTLIGVEGLQILPKEKDTCRSMDLTW